MNPYESCPLLNQGTVARERFTFLEVHATVAELCELVYVQLARDACRPLSYVLKSM